MAVRTVRLATAVYEKLLRLANERGIGTSVLMREIIEEWVARHTEDATTRSGGILPSSVKSDHRADALLAVGVLDARAGRYVPGRYRGESSVLSAPARVRSPQIRDPCTPSAR
jgi:predicted transcriptional regulator